MSESCKGFVEVAEKTLERARAAQKEAQKQLNREENRKQADNAFSNFDVACAHAIKLLRHLYLVTQYCIAPTTSKCVESWAKTLCKPIEKLTQPFLMFMQNKDSDLAEFKRSYYGRHGQIVPRIHFHATYLNDLCDQLRVSIIKAAISSGRIQGHIAV